ncbi:transporter substrate-binding domain-containing protein [Bifidobacterium platyrrhinorum]|uniref:Transporter substrate-binding domain-containing protein n=1 Tax=Bifidobacterium platyrrhinorum TaxID=2661628 RepID=A0A6L9SS87_9BIFI|nr:transporter substrate-binding domain-containing protein [Bifidobacterium platyrrhinorum]NEG55348.1 transporter substrate-binding domain-containing protein [Bifidobacterium platyrrhinorum]
MVSNSVKSVCSGLIAAAMAISLAACGSAASTSGDGSAASADSGVKQETITASEVKELHDALPQEIKDKGEITIGYQNTAGLPYGVVGEDGKDQGLNVDAANLIGEVLGVKVKGQGADFSQLIPGLQANRYDLVTNITTDTAERREVVDFIDVLYGEPSSLVVNKGSDQAGKTLDDVCGITIGVDSGSTHEEKAKAQAAKCKEEGKDELKVSAFKGISNMLLALKSNRVDAVYLSMGASRYYAKQDPQIQLSKPNSDIVELNGFMVNKGSELGPLVRKVMLHLNQDGTWKKLLDKYGLADLAPSDAVVENTEADYQSLLDAAKKQRS